MSEEQKERFKELWVKFWAGECSQEEAHEFAVLTTYVPINSQTGEIALIDEGSGD